ncbi:hypothetical protein [Pseudomonas sp. TWR1-1-4]|uniref:hypothetical protein n=1 Tax=Pseudomonas sp. TWR1-1-4 TaxID=2804604 RepID=UPI003CF18A2F
MFSLSHAPTCPGIQRGWNASGAMGRINSSVPASFADIRFEKIMTRWRAFSWAVLVWLALQVASWAFNKWLDGNANGQNIGAGLAYLSAFLNYLTSGFGIGFVAGAAIFSAWDWPLLGQWLKKRRQRHRNKDADEALAKKCEVLGGELYESASQIERLRAENHWGIRDEQDIHDSWVKARQAESREEERVRGKLGQRMQSIIIELRHRGLKMDVWGLSLRTHDLHNASYFFLDIASSLRAGDYLEREFSASRAGLPAMI